MREPARILVVDDVPDNVEVLQMRLERQGYEVVTAGDGVEALAKIHELLPDLVLLDIMMPKLADLFQRFDPVARGDDLVALTFEPHLQDLDIVRDIVDDQDPSWLAHFVTPRRAGIRGSWRAIGAG